ncbi:MAG: AN1-type zinc finger domain-containing protein, partial [archaeon]
MSDEKCSFCRKKFDEFPFTCKFCGREFCSEHRLPENHECP